MREARQYLLATVAHLREALDEASLSTISIGLEPVEGEEK